VPDPSNPLLLAGWHMGTVPNAHNRVTAVDR
jgi:hypothetical protein